MTEQKLTSPIDLFYSYAHEDEVLRNELNKHLSLLRRDGLIKDWHDREIGAGTEWERENQHSSECRPSYSPACQCRLSSLGVLL